MYVHKMHICFHMFLFVWCRISLVVSVQPVFSISKFWIIYTNSSFTFAHFHDQFLCAQCRKESSRCFLPAAMITTISESVLHQNEFHNRFIGFSPILFHLHFYTTILSHSNFFTCNSFTSALFHNQFFHFFTAILLCSSNWSIASTSRLGAFCRRRWSQPFPSLLFSPQHHSTRRLNWICH